MSKSIPINIKIVSEETAPASRRDALENRERILETADKLFAERGVAEVNMADIAKEAGVGKGTLYRRFDNKSALCLALMDEQMRLFQEKRLAQMRKMSEAGEPYLKQLEDFLEALVYFNDVHMPLLREVQKAGLEVEIAGIPNRPHFWQYMTVSGLLKTAVSAGELSPDLDIAYLADALLAPLNAHIFALHRHRQFSLERISAGLRTLVAGLAQLQ